MCTRLPPTLTIYSYTCSGYILVATKSLIVPWPITWNFFKVVCPEPALRFGEKKKEKKKKKRKEKERKEGKRNTLFKVYFLQQRIHGRRITRTCMDVPSENREGQLSSTSISKDSRSEHDFHATELKKNQATVSKWREKSNEGYRRIRQVLAGCQMVGR